jgi:hypothetical protein
MKELAHLLRQRCCAKPLRFPQACAEQVEQVNDHLEVGKREAQEKELLALLRPSDDSAPLQYFNSVFDESGEFLLFPSWRGISVAAISSGQVC